MRILMVSQDFPPERGGIQRYTHELAREFSISHRVCVLAPTQKGDRAFDRNLPYEVVRCPVLSTSLFGVATLFFVPSASRRFQPDIHFHAQYTTARGSMIAKKMGLVKRYFVAVHGREMLVNHAGPFTTWLRRTALKNAAGNFAVSRFTAGLVAKAGVMPHCVHVVPNGVDLNHFYPRPTAALARELNLTPENQVMMTTCRLLPHKGIDTTIRAVERLRHQFPNLVYIVIGDGPDKKRLCALAPEAVADGRLRFVGAVEHERLPVYLSLADLFVMPSRQQRDGSVEGFGLVYLEAGACGTPVVAADSGGISDAVAHGESGLLVPPEDEVRLSDTIARLFTDDNERNTLGKNGRDRAERFTWSRSAARILDITSTQ